MRIDGIARIAEWLLVTSILLSPALGQNKAGEYKGPSCLADYCFSNALPSETALVSQHGPGLHIGESRCYADSAQGAYVHFDAEHDVPGRIVTVIVSDVSSCDAPRHTLPKSVFPPFITKEGIGLGNSKEKIIKAYGNPTSTRPGADALGSIVPHSRARRGNPFGETVLVYDGPELLQSKFYLRANKVAAIYISCAE